MRLTWRGVMVALAVFVVLAQVVLLDLADERLRVPFFPGGDGFASGMLLKNVMEHGWVNNNPELGAPLGQHILDHPQPDILHHFLGGTVLGNLSGNWAAGMNLYYIAIPVLAALAMAWLLRRLGVSPSVAFVAAALFGMTPYHFHRNEHHLFLGATYPIPLAAYLVLAALGAMPLFARREGASGPLAWATWTSFATVGSAVVVASSGAYYAWYTLVLLGVAFLVRLVATRSVRSVIPIVVAAGMVAFVMALCLAPGLLWRLEHGANNTALQRTPSDTEFYALKPAQMVLPHPYHRVDRLAALSNRYLKEFPLPSEVAQPLGFVGTLGFLGSIGAVVAAALAGRGVGDERVRRLGGLNLFLVLYGVVGGAATVISLTLNSQFRSSNRVSIFIAAFSLIAMAFWLDKLRRRWPSQPVLNRLVSAGLVVLLLGGLLDQTGAGFKPDEQRRPADWDSDGDLVAHIERTLGEGAMVYQLPFVRFPESPPPAQMQPYDHLRGYLHSDKLRWSYGGMKARAEGEWPARLIGYSAAETLRALAALGFGGIYIDRFGYDDRGAAVEADLARELGGAPPKASANGRLSFFDIRAYADRAKAEMDDGREDEIRKLLLSTPPPEFGDGFFLPEGTATQEWNWMEATGEILLATNTPSDRPVPVHFRLASGHAGSWRTTLIDGDGRRHQFDVTNTPTDIRLELRLDSERTMVTIETTAPPDASADPRDLHLQVFEVRVGDAELRPLLAPA